MIFKRGKKLPKLSCHVFPSHPPILCWGWIWYCGWWMGKKDSQYFWSQKECVRKALWPKKPQTNKQTNKLLYYLQRATTFEYRLAVFSVLPSERCLWSPPEIPVSEDAVAQYRSWLHLSGNCYRWFNSLADKTRSKHHPRVQGPYLD